MNDKLIIIEKLIRIVNKFDFPVLLSSKGLIKTLPAIQWQFYHLKQIVIKISNHLMGMWSYELESTFQCLPKNLLSIWKNSFLNNPNQWLYNSCYLEDIYYDQRINKTFAPK
jgi:hypothetical protein